MPTSSRARTRARRWMRSPLTRTPTVASATASSLPCARPPHQPSPPPLRCRRCATLTPQRHIRSSSAPSPTCSPPTTLQPRSGRSSHQRPTMPPRPLVGLERRARRELGRLPRRSTRRDRRLPLRLRLARPARPAGPSHRCHHRPRRGSARRDGDARPALLPAPRRDAHPTRRRAPTPARTARPRRPRDSPHRPHRLGRLWPDAPWLPLPRPMRPSPMSYMTPSSATWTMRSHGRQRVVHGRRHGHGGRTTRRCGPLRMSNSRARSR